MCKECGCGHRERTIHIHSRMRKRRESIVRKEEPKMHEMAIAEGILGIALDQAHANDAQRIERIHLLLGELSGVETEALTLAFSSLVRGTIAEQADLTWDRIPLSGRCHDCGRERTLRPQDYLCPDCGGGMEFTHGREMRVDYIEME